MNYELFLIFGGLLVLSALAISFVGVKSDKFPGSRGVLLGLTTFFFALVMGTAAFGWLHAVDEQHHREHEPMAEESAAKQEAGVPMSGMGAKTELALTSPASGALVYSPEGLKAAAGAVEIVYDNPSMVPHNVALEFEGKEIGKSQIVTDGKTTLRLDLDPGEYVFYCTVPGHRQAGMEGDLLVTGRVN
ncbi:MAG: cupredoxin domain-containing protein [bacterium]